MTYSKYIADLSIVWTQELSSTLSAKLFSSCSLQDSMKQGKIFERTLSALTSILAALLGLLLPPQQSHCCEKMVTFVVFGGM